MNKLLKFSSIYRDYIVKTSNDDNYNQILERLKREYPNLNRIPSLQEARSFFERVVPYLIYKHIYCSFSLRQCGNMSFVFGAIANEHGFPTMEGGTSNHFFNIMLTKEGFVVVDLTEAQFDYSIWARKERLDPEDENTLQIYLDGIVKNPFKSTKFFLTKSINQNVIDHFTVPQSTDIIGNKPLSDFEKMDSRLKKMVEKEGIEWGAESDPSVADGEHSQSETRMLYPKATP